jgi:hypothetical protein
MCVAYGIRYDESAAESYVLLGVFSTLAAAKLAAVSEDNADLYGFEDIFVEEWPLDRDLATQRVFTIHRCVVVTTDPYRDVCEWKATVRHLPDLPAADAAYDSHSSPEPEAAAGLDLWGLPCSADCIVSDPRGPAPGLCEIHRPAPASS